MKTFIENAVYEGESAIVFKEVENPDLRLKKYWNPVLWYGQYTINIEQGKN